jgi:hypothetical protein
MDILDLSTRTNAGGSEIVTSRQKESPREPGARHEQEKRPRDGRAAHQERRPQTQRADDHRGHQRRCSGIRGNGVGEVQLREQQEGTRHPAAGAGDTGRRAKGAGRKPGRDLERVESQPGVSDASDDHDDECTGARRAQHRLGSAEHLHPATPRSD